MQYPEMRSRAVDDRHNSDVSVRCISPPATIFGMARRQACAQKKRPSGGTERPKSREETPKEGSSTGNRCCDATYRGSALPSQAQLSSSDARNFIVPNWRNSTVPVLLACTPQPFGPIRRATGARATLAVNRLFPNGGPANNTVAHLRKAREIRSANRQIRRFRDIVQKHRCVLVGQSDSAKRGCDETKR